MSRPLWRVLCSRLLVLAGWFSSGCEHRDVQPIRTSADVTAAVQNVKARMLESVPHVNITIEFSNHGERAAVVDSFRIFWPTGQRVVSDAGLVIPPNQSTLDTVRIVTADVVAPDAVRIELLVVRELSTAERLRRRLQDPFKG